MADENKIENVSVTTNEDINPETPEVDETSTKKKNLFAVALAAGIGFVVGRHAKKWDVDRVARKELEKRKKQKEKEEKKRLKEMIKDAKANPEKYVTDADVDLEEDNE